MPVELVNPKLFNPTIPTSIMSHALFSTKTFKNHQMRDERWVPQSITHQYEQVVHCLGKNMEYKRLEHAANLATQYETLQSLRNECYDGRTRIKMAAAGNIQKIRNILMAHKDMQRLYTTMPSHLIIDNMNQRTFVLRKENDRLTSRLSQLTKKYKLALIDQARYEDRIKYQKEFMLQAEIDAMYCEKNLSRSQTRIRALKNIQRAYKQMIISLFDDDIFFEPILDSLEKDIAEQQNFIQQVILMGVPAIEKQTKLVESFQQAEKAARMLLKENISFISKSKKKLLERNIEVKHFVRKKNESDGPKRNYVRETHSMIRLINAKDDIEKVIEALKNATLSTKVTKILPKFKHMSFQTKKMAKTLDRETEASLLYEENLKLAKAFKDPLKFTLTDEETKRLQEIKELKVEIDNQQKLQKELDDKVLSRGVIFNQLTVAILHLNDILRHNGTPIENTTTRKYPNDILELPLLNFTAKPSFATPPNYLEIGGRKLQGLVEIKTRKLAAIYESIMQKEKGNVNHIIDRMANDYDNAYLETLETDVGLKKDDGPALIIVQEKDDPNVLNRKQIKALSAKIVEDNRKLLENQ